MYEDKNFKQKIKKQCLDALEELKAQNIKTLNVEKSSSFTSIIIIATGTSNRHIQSISDKVFKNLKDSQFDIIGKEGCDSNEWVLIDAGEVLVNIMSGESREHYDLESLWER